MFEYSLRTFFCLIIAAIVFIAAIIIGGVGAGRLVAIRQQARALTNTTCSVSNITNETLPYSCTCDGCQVSACYAEHFAVQYVIGNGTQISSTIHIDEIPRLLQIQVNNTYPCFYDQTNAHNVHWYMPNERPALAMLIVGFTIAGIIVVAIISLQIWSLIQHRISPSKTFVQF